jgi:hypothetical protein
MSEMYNIPTPHSSSTRAVIEDATEFQLQQWANDPNCYQQAHCAAELQRREAKQVSSSEQLDEPRKQLQERPFDPRTEISADALHIANRIVAHLWIIFVLLPFVVGVLYVLVTLAKTHQN